MRKACALVFVLGMGITLCLCAHGQQPGGNSKAKAATPDSQAENEIRLLEAELVRLVKKRLAQELQENPRAGSKGPGKKEAPQKATLPEPPKYDARKLQEQIRKWKEKLLAEIDMLTTLILNELKEAHVKQLRELKEAYNDRKRTVNGKYRLKEAKRKKELAKLNQEYHRKKFELTELYYNRCDELEKQAAHKKELMQKLAKEVEEKLLPEKALPEGKKPGLPGKKPPKKGQKNGK